MLATLAISWLILASAAGLSGPLTETVRSPPESEG